MARPSLHAALDSLARQDYPALDIVLVDALGPGHPLPPTHAGAHRVRFVPAAALRRRPVAANAGLDACRGEWITFLDDDDTLMPTHVSGLVAATARAGSARVVHSLAVITAADGSVRLFGQPCAPVELYQRNFIQMSTALWAASLCAQGCRFDAQLPIHEDWDFFLQCAQHTSFHFEPLRSFRWNAEAGESGTFGRTNFAAVEFARVRDLVYAKWQSRYDALVATIMPLLAHAGQAAQAGDAAAVRSDLASVFAASPDDPSALNLLAMLERSEGQLEAAVATQRRSVAVRPLDPALVFNLALLLRATGRREEAQRLANRTVQLAPGFAPVRSLLADLAKDASA